MVPSHRTLAELALKRQEELSRQLAGTQWSSSASLLPNVLRRCIVTISVCHETLRSLQAAAENGPRIPDGRPRVVRLGDGTSELRGRYGSVAVSIPIEGARPAEDGAGARLRRAHLTLAVDSARVAYGDLLSSSDWIAHRRAVDGLLGYLANLGDGEGAPESSGAFQLVAEGAHRIRILLDARRPSVESSNALYRELVSLNVEGMAWSYCAALLADSLRQAASGACNARAAIRRVDELRAGLERPQSAASPAGPVAPPYEDRTSPPGRIKP